jgi:chromosome segregation ATPase
MPAKILFRDAQNRDGVVELRGEPVWVGRAMECAIRTDDAMVSRKHSMIRFDQGRYWVEDLGSSNGTHVNDVKVQRQALNHNDVVRCGSLWLRYVEDGPMFGAGAPQAGMGMGGAPMGAPRTQILNPSPAAPPATDFGFQSTVATPRSPTQGLPQGGLGGGLSPQSYSGGGRSVVVDMGDSGEAQRYRQQADELRSQYELVRGERDKEVAENKRLRAEASNLTQRLEDAKTQAKESEEAIDGLKRLVEDIRSENEQTRERDGRMTTQLAEAQEDLASRTRQLQRANDDINKMKQEMEQYKRQTLELTRMKDEGFKKLNEQLAEVEHLREVIREQERMLEERRVGLISLEEAMKDLRGEREARIKEIAQLKGERDEVRIGFNRREAQLQATEEENRRLSRLMAELQAGGGGTTEVSRLSADLKEARSEQVRLSSEVDRLENELVEVERRSDKLARALEEAREAGGAEDERVKAAEAQQRKAEEARVKAESQRMRAEDDKAAAIKARDEAQQEVAALKKRLADQADQPAGGKQSGNEENLERKVAELTTKVEEAQAKVAAAAKRYEEAEERARKLEADAQKARSSKPAAGGGGDSMALREKAGEVYQSINDVLSELKVNIAVVREEFEAYSGKNPDARSRTIRDAIDAAAGQTEDVKGVLRALREMSEG